MPRAELTGARFKFEEEEIEEGGKAEDLTTAHLNIVKKIKEKGAALRRIATSGGGYGPTIKANRC